MSLATDCRRLDILQNFDPSFQSCLDAVPDNVCIVGDGGDILAVNAAWSAFASANGVNPDSVGQGANYLDVCAASARSDAIDADIAERAMTGITGVINRNLSSFSLQYPCNSPTEERWFTLRALPLRIGFDPSARCLISHINISDIKRLEVEARKANAIKAHFLAMMSHEFRTPLNAILGFSELIKGLESKTGYSLPASEYIDAIRQSGQHLLALVDDLLDVSAIEAGTRSLNRTRLDIGPILTTCAKNLAILAQAKGIEIVVETTNEPLPVIADKTALIQIFSNLLVNAIKFSHEGSTVVVVARPGNGKIEIAFVDHGIGIPEYEIELMTKPFWRAQSDAHIANEGTGLGLSIVQALVEQHLGKLEIHSKVGEGTTVTIILPSDN
ncbi:MAG: ATP-binding protein [Rhodospirillales bacterium]